MKKFFCSLLMAAIFFVNSAAMAAYEETVTKDADIASIKTLAVALPMHYKVEITEPNPDEFADIVSNAGSRLVTFNILSYDDVVDKIWDDVKVDIKALNDKESRKIFIDNIAKYADAYVIATSANNNKITQIFFEVRDSKTGDTMYIFNTQSRRYSKDLKGYTRACEDFYKRFNAVVEKAVKDSRKKK